MTQELNTRTIKAGIAKVAQFIQDEKVDISQDTIKTLQRLGAYPEVYNSWVGTKNKANLYVDPEKFFRVMRATPKAFDKDFFFEPTGSNSELIRKATIDAFDIIYASTRDYIAAPNVSGTPNQSTGFLLRSYRIEVDGRYITSTNELENIAGNTVRIVNLAEYASTAEVNALYYANTSGIMYFAANTIARKYPELAINFGWNKADIVQGTYHNYEIPVLTIGAKGTVNEGIDKPGVRLRRDKRRNFRRSNRG